MWQIYLSDERSYTVPGVLLKIEAHVSMDTEEIVGFNVFDETLRDLAKTTLSENKPVSPELSEEKREELKKKIEEAFSIAKAFCTL
jgi:hypothetical protein